MDQEDGDTVRHESANLLRRSGYRGLTTCLLRILERPQEGPRFRAFCVQHLWLNMESAAPEERAMIAAFLRRALEDRHTSVRREALLALTHMRDPRGQQAVVEWLTAENAEGLRDVAIHCVSELDLREFLLAVRKHARDANEVARIAAIVTLSQWGDEESRPAIEEAAKSDSFRLRRCAEMALKRLDRAGKAADSAQPDGKAPEAVPPKAGKPGPDF